MEPLPPYLEPDAVDEEAERVVSALAAVWGAPRWRVTDDRTAAWVMAKLAAATAELAEAEAAAEVYRSRIADWLEARTRKAVGTRKWAEFHLCSYMEDLHAADPKVKSRVLPDGKLASTAGRLEWQVVDPAAAVQALTDEGLAELVVPATVAGVQKLAATLKPDEETGVVRTPDGTTVPGLVVARKPRTYRATPS